MVTDFIKSNFHLLLVDLCLKGDLSAFQHAIRSGHGQLADLFISKGSNIDARNKVRLKLACVDKLTLTAW